LIVFMASYKTEAIILKRINFSEADKILTIFSKHYGKIHVLAKGVRKINSRKGGNLELFNQVNLFLAKGRNLDIITEVELQDSFKSWRRNLIRVGVAFYLTELVDKLTAESQQNVGVFSLLRRSLLAIGDRTSLSELIREFEEKMLDGLGFGVPKQLRDKPGSLSDYIEEVVEKRLKSKDVLKRIQYGK